MAEVRIRSAQLLFAVWKVGTNLIDCVNKSVKLFVIVIILILIFLIILIVVLFIAALRCVNYFYLIWVAVLFI